jgi:hypothetical protein
MSGRPSHSRNRARAAASAFVFVVCALAAGGCSSGGGLVNMWRDPEYRAAPLTKVYVVAMKKDATNRRLLEDAFVAELGKRGVTARASYRQFADAAPDTQQVIEEVRANGWDGVLVASKLPTEENSVFVPGYTTRETRQRLNRWTGRYYTVWEDVHHPGYTETETVVRHQVDVWTTRDGGQLVWSGVSERYDPTHFDVVANAIVDQVVPELSKQGLIPKK